MSVSSYQEFSKDDVYTGEPKEKASNWICVGLMIAFIVIFAIIFSLPSDMQSAIADIMDFTNPIFYFVILPVAAGLSCFLTSRKKSKNVDL